MLLNFYETDNLQEGKQIIDAALADDDVKYIQNFRQVNFFPPDPNDHSAVTRFNRRVLVYHALLKKAGFEPPNNIKPYPKGLFNKELIEAMQKAGEVDEDNEGRPEFGSAAKILGTDSPTWDATCQCIRNIS